MTSSAGDSSGGGSWLSNRLAESGTDSKFVFDLSPRPALELPTMPVADVTDRKKMFSDSMPFPTTTALEEPTEFPDVVLNDVDATAVEKKIIRQMEFYFGDHNLPKDMFLVETLENEGGEFYNSMQSWLACINH